MSAGSSSIIDATAAEINVCAGDVEGFPVSVGAARSLMHSDEVAVKSATADVDSGVRSALVKRDSVSAGIGVRIPQQIDQPSGQIESALTIPVAAAAQAEPAVIYQRAAIDREGADATGADFNAAQASHRAAVQCEKTCATCHRTNLEHIPVVGFTGSVSLDDE